MSRQIAFITALLLAVSPALAGGVEVSQPWSRATVRGASVAAGYMTIDNQGGAADTLKGGVTDRAERVEIHQSREEGGIMTMRAVPKGVEIKPGKQLVLKPGGYHLMIIGLKSAFLPGETVHVTLQFEKAGDVGADLKVVGFGANGPEGTKPAEK
ncbi:copper chaperone PCu(A)C [Rhodoblastus acidophilus]|jgi:periplasmic copper chaperone A|uniref:Copper chaperone PCu(A)C n=1 Tax=Rhodoblastus acidophilus TaxID=1074 RepID=A0A6N8DLI8_RHOAC|nr:copper chaperone PCu(A)C [Rhodoblastus acidophilus]MCW2275068.1 copper(I)-binding protein [Rhodoblastus acidophilus]MTV31339.1 copper chaperone PCu(A)C [Rhodoblastus acidophilus]